MTADPILLALQPLEERPGDRLQVFIPASMAARCADCAGIFLAACGKCPGCGSTSYVLDAKEEARRV